MKIDAFHAVGFLLGLACLIPAVVLLARSKMSSLVGYLMFLPGLVITVAVLLGSHHVAHQEAVDQAHRQSFAKSTGFPLAEIPKNIHGVPFSTEERARDMFPLKYPDGTVRSCRTDPTYTMVECVNPSK